MPSVKNRYWDGKVRLFSIKTKRIYIGLLLYVDEFCRERGYEFEGVTDVLGSKVRNLEVEDFLRSLNLPFEPRDYQFEAFHTAVQYGRQLLLSPTASINLLSYIYSLDTMKRKLLS